jgi:membrane protease YdiL (CAAX protease family)
MLTSVAPPYAQYRKNVSRMGWSMLLFVGVFDVCNSISTIVGMLGDLSAASAAFTFFYGILSVVCYMAPFFVAGAFYYCLSRRDRVQRASFEIKLPREFPLWIFAGMACLTAAAYLNSWFCSAIGYTIPEELLLAGSYDDPTAVILYMTVALAPAFAEEFLFRGVFYTNLRPFGRTQAIIISSLLFALMHQNIGQLFYTFVGGIVMALMYEKTGSIWCNVFFHMFNNEMSVIYELLYYREGGEAMSVYLTLLEAILFLIGVISLVILVVFHRKERTTSDTMERYEAPVPSSLAVRGALCPGMVAFTAVTVVLMLLTWLSLILMSGGGV